MRTVVSSIGLIVGILPVIAIARVNRRTGQLDDGKLIRIRIGESIMINPIEFVFSRMYMQQKSRLPSANEAAHSAITFMIATPLATIVGLDFLLANYLNTPPIFHILGKWAYSAILFCALYVLHYVIFVRGGKAIEIENKYKDLSLGYYIDIALSIMYVLLVPVAVFIIIALSSDKG